MPLLNLSNELFLIIIEDLGIKDVNAFSQTCHRLNSLLTPFITKYVIQNKDSLLSWAVENGYVSLAKTVLDYGANIYAECFGGHTALYFSIIHGHNSITKLLLGRGLDINSVDISQKIGPPLSLAVFCGKYSTVKLLLESGADVNKGSTVGITALHWSAQRRNLVKLNMLLNHGADIFARFQGRMAIHMAAARGNESAVRALLDRGCSVDECTNSRETVLHKAVANIGVVSLLIERGANVRAFDAHRKTPLHMAAKFGCTEVIQLLLEKGANIAARDENGWTALHEAVSSRNEESALVLLQNGADIAVQDDHGATAVDVAMSEGWEELALLLTENYIGRYELL